MTLDEFNILYDEWNKYQTALYRTTWEQARFMAHCSVIPYAKRGLNPTDLLRFDWDKDTLPDLKTATKADFERIREMFRN